MASWPSPYECGDPVCKDATCLDLQITSHSTSDAVTIPYPRDHPKYKLPKNVPPILRKRSADPGLSKLPRKDILGYIPVHYERTPKPSDTRFAKSYPIRLGVKVPPGFGPKSPPRKDPGFEIVPDEIPPEQNRRAQNQWTWQSKQVKKEGQKIYEIAQQKMKEGVGKEQERMSLPSGDGKARCDSVMSDVVSFV